MEPTTHNNKFIKDLGDGLILRRSTPADVEKLGAFNNFIHNDTGDEKVGLGLTAWTSDLLTRPHPTFGSDDFTVVEEQATGRIVSSLNLISQTWAYAGLPFGVGRPELVGTLPEYRNKRLVKIQMDEVHAWSQQRGQLAQVITGIPHYYKRFEYDMALELGGSRSTFAPLVPQLKEGESEPYVMRPVTEADIPFLMQVYEYAGRRSLVYTVRDEALWRYEVFGRSAQNINRSEFRIIESATGESVGYLAHPWFNWSLGLALGEYELKPGVSWLAVTPSVARYVLATGKAYAARDKEPLDSKSGVSFAFGSTHPVYAVWHDRLPRVRPPYAYYVRVPDLPGFLRLIAPVLEKRLAESYLAGHTGDLKICLYKTGLQLNFEHGQLKAVDTYQPQPRAMGDVAFPDLTFLQALFGFHTFAELQESYRDCYSESNEAQVLTNALFPKKSSWVAGVV